MRNYERFRISLVLTLVLSACAMEVSRGVFDLRAVLGLVLLYGGSVFLRDRLYSSENTFFDYDHREIARPSEDLIILGNRVRNLASQSRERTLLIALTRPGKDRWKILGGAFAFSALAVWIHMRVHGLIFWETAGSVFIISGVFLSAFVVQMLLPAFLALGLVGLALSRSREMTTVIMASLFFVSFLVTLILYRGIDADRANPKRTTQGLSALRAGLLWAAVFLGLFWVFNKLVPEPSSGSAVSVERPKLNREIAHQVLKLQDRLGKTQRPRGGGSDHERPSVPEPGAEPPKGPMAAEPVPEGPPLDELPSRKAGLEGEGRGDHGDAGSDTGGDKGGDTSGDTSGGSDERGGDEPGGARDSRAERGAKSLAPSSPRQASNTDRESRLKELEKKIELPMEITKGVLVVVGIIFGLLMLAKYFFKPSDDPEKEIRVQQISKKQRERLRTILQQIHAKGLSAQDEVIETYNALMTVFQVGEHRREEWLPPEEFSIQIGRSLPSLKTSFDEVTMRFSRTLYGEKPVSDLELSTYRDGVTRILKFFQVN